MTRATNTNTDPLTSATRATKRNLLAVSVVAILFKAFDVTITKLPISGLEIAFGQGAFEFLLLACLAYFLPTFGIYYFIDIKNFKPLDHQVNTEEWWIRTRSVAIESHSQVMMRRIKALGAPHLGPELHTNNYTKTLEDLTQDNPSAIRLFLRLRGTQVRDELLTSIRVDDELLELFAAGDATKAGQLKEATEKAKDRLKIKLHAELRRFPWWYVRATAVGQPRLFSVRGLYVIRNFGIDGALPVALALFALGAVLELFDVRWIASFTTTGQS